MHVFVFYFLLIAFSILVYLLFSYSAIRLQECSIKSVSQSVPHGEFLALLERHLADSRPSNSNCALKELIAAYY